MKKINSPWLLAIILFIIVNSVIIYNEVSLFIDDLQLEMKLQREEIIKLKSNINKQDKTIEEQQQIIDKQQKIIEEKDKEIEELRTLRNVRVTAYSPHDDKNGINSEGNPSITSIGLTAEKGVVAVDPSKIPYGTMLDIPGYGNSVAGDTGGALRNYDGIAIDVHLDTYEEAMAWGIQYLDVIIK